MATNPGHPNQGAIRRNSRAFGIILTVVGAAVLIGGLVLFISAFSNDYDPFEEDGIPRPVFGIIGIFGGGVLIVVGRALLAAGYGGAVLRYAAGEASPVLKDTLAHLREESAAQREPASTADAGSAAGAVAGAESSVGGPFCSRCGVRNDVDARFCDACGTALATP